MLNILEPKNLQLQIYFQAANQNGRTDFTSVD
jgi:hypothetical protein